MNTPRRHHFVPKILLKRFTDQDGWLHFFNKDDPEPTVRRARPTNLFVQNHYYSEIASDGSRDTRIEHWLGKLENDAEPILSKIISSVERNKLPNLTANERFTWVRFFVTQWRRVPDLHDQTRNDFAAKEFDAVIGRVKNRFPNRETEIEALQTTEQKARIIRNAYARMLQNAPSEPERVVNERGIVFLSIDADKAFIIGSRPVIQMNFTQGQTLADHSSEMWLPISSKIAVGVGYQWEREKLLYLRDGRAIRHLNTAIAENSSSFASSCKKLTASIARSLVQSLEPISRP